ncbi:MAG: flagellar biosynthesis anti-sigma factor FlgM [Oscillospiraceae bacterium]|nr:flagellar biosynthesis anti-sigma factor FlgM [Oscillospiraceae bacterium]
MNINFNVCNGYMKTNEIGSQSLKEFSGIRPAERTVGKHDTVSISSEAASFAEVDRSTKAIASEVSTCAPQEKINSLKAQIAAGTYNVSAGDVADAILSRLAF